MGERKRCNPLHHNFRAYPLPQEPAPHATFGFIEMTIFCTKCGECRPVAFDAPTPEEGDRE